MITEIKKLSNFGNYRQFQWGTNRAFTKRNLIYGWNYSGKTTLSRFFQVLSGQKNLLEFPACEFEVEFKDGRTFTQDTFKPDPSIGVFNRDFIKDNFLQEYTAPALFVVGENAIHLRKKIARLNTHQQKLETIKSRLYASVEGLKKELESIGTSEASAVATLTGDKNYNRPKLFAKINEVRANAPSFLLTDTELSEKVSLLHSKETWTEMLAVASPTVKLDVLRSDLENTLSKTASNEAIAKLKDNRELESWIRTGLVQHKNLTRCEFCTSVIPDNRMQSLQKHFSKAYEDLNAEVANRVANLERSKVQFLLPNDRELMPDMRHQFMALRDKLIAWANWANGVVNELLALARSKQFALETRFNCHVDINRNSDVAPIIEAINALLASHNQRRLKLSAEKSSAKAAIEMHRASTFFQIESVSAKETAIAEIESKLIRVKEVVARISEKKFVIEAQVQKLSIAAQKINETIQFLLPDNSISVVEVPGGSFEFRRDNVSADNLSDGEKTAITFAYFLVTIENKGASLSRATVFIDDPISSLDSNHVYAVYALITKRLAACEQIFVSTHNSELYTLLKDVWFFPSKQFADTPESSAYYIRRFFDYRRHWHSTIESLPELLRKYKSEYQFVFEQLHKFSSSTSASLHEAYTAPNMLRKFLEAYLGFRKPCVSAWSKKLDLLFDSDVEQAEIQKFSDDASHLQGLSRALQQPDFIANGRNTVKKVLEALKDKDPQHYESMCKVINVAH